MKKKIILSLLILTLLILALTSFEKNKLDTSMTGMYVDNFLIENNKTIPDTVIEESIQLNLRISCMELIRHPFELKIATT